MKFKESLIFHEKLIKELGDDLVYSVSYDQGKYYLSISTHRSKTQEYSHGRQIQTALIDDFNDNIDKLVAKVVPLYKDILVEKQDKDDETANTE